MLVTSHRSSVSDAIAAAIAYGVDSPGADIVAFHGMIALSHSSLDGDFARQSVVEPALVASFAWCFVRDSAAAASRAPVGVLPQR